MVVLDPVCPPGMVGMTDASTTRSFSAPIT
jgi:hypothetical protein